MALALAIGMALQEKVDTGSSMTLKIRTQGIYCLDGRVARQ